MKASSGLILRGCLFFSVIVFCLETMAEDTQQIGAPQDQGEDQHGRGFLQVTNGGSKREWPEVVGLAVEEAEQKIKEDMPRAIFQVLPQGSFVTMDFNLRRVRIFVDQSRKVARPPRVG